MSLTDLTRGLRMGDRVLRTFEEKGGDPAMAPLLRALHACTVQHRGARFEDDHDPAFLHPGRSALILLIDLEKTDLRPLAAALLHDSDDADLTPAIPAIEEALDRYAPPSIGVGELLEDVASLPETQDDSLAERLVLLDDDLRAAALAERLDHLRHLHLRDVDPAARAGWREARDVWLPVAERTDPVLARRYGWWVRRFRGVYGSP